MRVKRRRIASVEAVPCRIAVAYLIIWSYLLLDEVPADRAGQRRGQLRVGVGFAGDRPVQPHLVDLLDPGQQVEAQQPGDAEPDLGLAMGVDVVALDVHGGAVPHRALDHRGDLGRGGPQVWEWMAIDPFSTCQ